MKPLCPFCKEEKSVTFRRPVSIYLCITCSIYFTTYNKIPDCISILNYPISHFIDLNELYSLEDFMFQPSSKELIYRGPGGKFKQLHLPYFCPLSYNILSLRDKLQTYLTFI
jgi:hypothetical protein